MTSHFCTYTLIAEKADQPNGDVMTFKSINLKDSLEILRVVADIEGLSEATVLVFHDVDAQLSGFRHEDRHYPVEHSAMAALIKDRWFIKHEASVPRHEDAYEFNESKRDQWYEEEEGRTTSVLQNLCARYPALAPFHCKGYRIIEHSQSTEHATRGYECTDKLAQRYLVTPLGEVVHIPEVVRL